MDYFLLIIIVLLFLVLLIFLSIYPQIEKFTNCCQQRGDGTHWTPWWLHNKPLVPAVSPYPLHPHHSNGYSWADHYLSPYSHSLYHNDKFHLRNHKNCRKRRRPSYTC